MTDGVSDFVTKIRVGHDDFDVSEEIASLERPGRKAGAVVTFSGIVRADDGVTAMELEHYEGMTEKALREIVERARSRWSIEDVIVIHRVGKLYPGDRIVLTVVTSMHRREAFEASEFIMDWLKTEAPFWKKETRPDGEHWVDARESDEMAKNRWCGR